MTQFTLKVHMKLVRLEEFEVNTEACGDGEVAAEEEQC